MRICVDVTRPNQHDRSRGKVPPGLYLRDIGEVREGARAYDFMQNSDPPEEEDFNNCLSLIGTERTICLQLPSKVAHFTGLYRHHNKIPRILLCCAILCLVMVQFSRDWFHERFQIIIDDVLTELEKTVRAKLRWTLQGRGSVADRGSNASNQLRELLIRGLQVLLCSPPPCSILSMFCHVLAPVMSLSRPFPPEDVTVSMPPPSVSLHQSRRSSTTTPMDVSFSPISSSISRKTSWWYDLWKAVSSTSPRKPWYGMHSLCVYICVCLHVVM